MIIQELVDRCKGGVSLEVNEHRNNYESAKQAIDAMLKWECPPDMNKDSIPKMIETNTIYLLQFYPDTPIGFHSVIGATLDEVLEYAEECFKG